MATLAEYLRALLAAEGLVETDASLVEFNHPTWGWKPVALGPFRVAAEAVDVEDITPSLFPLLRFTVEASPGDLRGVQWNGTAYALLPAEPEIITLTASDLTS